MRNLKRALSLTLASVMLLGMMVVGTSAASYPDVGSDENVEAIEVVKAVGVMVGDENGNFNPGNEVTRNEMAVVMAKLLLGDAADSYVGTSPFTDVPDWADKYVAACYNNGIVAGIGNNQYGGTLPVTAEQAAAMMLRALGYEKLSDGAADWAQPVVAKAGQVGLFVDVVANGNPKANLNRNQVAQLTLNTLETTMVTTSSGSNLTIGDIVISNDVKYEEREMDVKSSDTNNLAIAIDGEAPAEGTAKVTIQLGEWLYDGDLVKATVTEGDDFGRPASKWVYDGKDIITVAEDANKIYVGQVTAKDLYSDLGLRAAKTDGGAAANTVDASNVTVTVDGVANEVTTGYSAKAIAKDDKTTKFGEDGQTVYAYYEKDADADNDEVIIVIISSYLGVVTDDNAKSGDKTGIRVDVNGASKFFETAGGYAEDDVVLLTMADGEIKEITGVPETVTGEITSVGASDYAVTIDKIEYPQAIQFDDADGSVIKGVASVGASAVGNTYTLYLDANGCYLAAVEDEGTTSTNLVYVFGVDDNDFLVSSSNKVEKKAMATVVEMDGTYRDVPLTYYDTDGTPTKITDATAESAASTLDGALGGEIAYLTYNEDDDEYTLTSYDHYDGDYDTAALPTPDADWKLAEDDLSTKFGKGDGTVYYLNDKTVYLFVSVDDGDIDKVEVFTGGVNANIDSATAGAFAFESNKRLGYVVFEAAYSASADDVIYIADASPVKNVSNGQTFKGYIVGEDSEEREIAIQTGANGAVKITGSGLYSYTSVKSNGNLDNLSALKTDSAGYVVNKAIASLVGVAGSFAGTNDDTYKFSNTIVVDVRDNKDVGGEINSVSALEKAINRSNYTVTVSAYINGDDEVVGLFVTNVAEPGNGGGNNSPAPVDKPLDNTGGGVDVAAVTAAFEGATAQAPVKVTITNGALTLDNALTIPANCELVVEQDGITTDGNDLTVNGSLTVTAGGITGTDSVTIAGSADITGAVGADLTINVSAPDGTDPDVVINGDVDGEFTVTSGKVEVTGDLTEDTTGVTVGAAGDLTVTGDVAKVADVVAEGSLTVEGDVTTVTNNHGTIEVTGSVTTITDNNGTLNVKAPANPQSRTLGAGEVGTITKITAGTVSIEGAVGSVGEIVDGTVTFGGDVTSVTKITAGTVTFEGGAEIAAITAGTINVGGEVTFKPTSAAAPTATFKIGESGSLVLDGDGGAITLSGATLEGEGASSTVSVKNVTSNNLVATTQLYDNKGDAVTSVSTDTEFTWNTTNEKFQSA